MIVGRKTLEYLGWHRILEGLEARTATPPGRARAGRLAFLDDEGQVRRELARVDELRELLDVTGPPDFAGIDDLSELVGRAGKEGVLLPEELLRIGDCLHGLARIRGYLADHRAELEANAWLQTRFHDLRALAGRIDASLERDGRIKDGASAVLHELRTRAATLHQGIRDQLERFIKDHQMEEALQEKFYTLREDRYVVPVRSERRGLVDGIVHAVSQSGATVFVEPAFLIAQNNRLKLLQEEVKREELYVLQDLSEEVAERGEHIRESTEMATVFDLVCARARLALDMEARRPQVGSEHKLWLTHARFPLLVLTGRPVVANDVGVGEGYRMLVLSGPNAGGKSVALKTCGLCVLMARAGLLIPAGADSYVPMLTGLHALPGDMEDVERQLSTFTGHLRALNETLAQVDAGHLVLIDEITVGTEPDQGSALGAGYLLELADSGALCVVATHYERLKAMAMGDSRFENAAMGMDWETLAPTYKLAVGTPGSSRTLEIARRFSVPERVITRALEVMQGKQAGMLEDAIRGLAQKQQEAQAALARHRETEAELAQLKRRRELALEELSRRADRVIGRRVERGLEDVDAALTRVTELVAQLQRERPDARTLEARRRTLKEVREQLDKRRRDVEAEEAARSFAGARAARFKEGGEVLVKKFGKVAVVTRLDEEEGMASLKMGAMRMRLALDELMPLESQAPATAPHRRVEAATPEPAERRLDLRGLSGDEAVDRVSRALDQAMLSPSGPLVVVHGHGTGRLKQAVRDWLAQTRYPIHFRPGRREEGGDGVTVVELD